MEYQKITNLLGTTPNEVPRFITKKWIKVHDHLGNAEDRYKPSKQIRFKTSMLRSDLCDFSDVYIVKGDITLTEINGKRNRFLAFKNNAPFTNCKTKINNVLTDNAKDLDVVMPMYNLIGYSKNYRKTTGSLWNYYQDEPINPPTTNYNADPIINSTSFKYKTSTTRKTSYANRENGENTEQGNTKTKKNLEIVVPLKHLSNFWRTLDMPLINCEVSLTLTWSENYVLTDTTQAAIRAQGDNPVRPAINAPTNAKFQTTDTKLYVPVVTLSTENDKRLLEKLRTGFKRTIKWNKYRSEMTNQTQNNNLNYLIDPTFTKVNGLFVLSFENEDDRRSFSKYYVANVEIKDFNVLIDGKSFFDMPIKNEEETYEQIIKMGRNNDYTTGNLLDYEYFSKHYKLIAIDLSKQIELENPDLKQQINFIRRFKRLEGATMFFIIEKSKETTFKF